MFQKILEKLGYISIEKHNEIVEILVKEKEDLDDANLTMKATIASFEKESKPLIEFSLGDPIPQDSEARKVYVAQVASFFKNILEEKLKFMLSSLHNMFEEQGSDRDFDLMLKGVAYSFRELMKWGNVMINEQVANQNTDIPEKDVENLKEKLNNSK